MTTNPEQMQALKEICLEVAYLCDHPDDEGFDNALQELVDRFIALIKHKLDGLHPTVTYGQDIYFGD